VKKFIITFISYLPAVFAQSIVYNPFTNNLDRIGAGGNVSGSGLTAAEVIQGGGGSSISASGVPVAQVARRDQDNTFSAGSKQTVQASSTTAAFRIVCAALPSTPATGDLACDSNDFNKLKWWDGSGWARSATTNALNTYTSKQTFDSNGTAGALQITCESLPSSPATGDLACDSADSNKLKIWNGTSWIATAGANLYNDLGDFKHTVTSSTRLDIASGRAGANGYTFPAPIGGFVNFTGGSGDAKVFVRLSDGQLVTQATTGITASVGGQMILENVATPAFPLLGAIPICDLAVSSGTYTVDQCGLANVNRGVSLQSGSGITLSATGTGTITVAKASTVPETNTTNTWTNTNDFSAATVYMPRGNGPMPLSMCDSDAEIGSEYMDMNPGGAKYRCEKILDTAGTDYYLPLPLGVPTQGAGCIFEDFLLGNSNTASSGNNGMTNVAMANLAGTGTFSSLASETNRWGLRRIVSGTTLDNRSGMIFGVSSNVNIVPDMSATTNYYYETAFRIVSTDTTADRVNFAGISNIGDFASSRAGLTYDTSASHTTWHIQTVNNNNMTGTDTDTGVAPSAGTWVKLTMWSTTAGTINYSLNSAAPVTHSANAPPTGGDPAVVVGTRVGGTGKGVDIDYMKFCWWGLNR
jgi:hypothetical protein